MTWVRLDDRWTDEVLVGGLPMPTRWHYLALVSWCCRMSSYEGHVRRVDARRCSDVDDPDQAVKELLDVGLLIEEPDGYRLTQIDRHTMPAYLRDEHRKAGQRDRKRRERARRQDTEASDTTSDVPPPVPRDTGTGRGQDRPVREVSSARDLERDVDDVPTPEEPPVEDDLRVPAEWPGTSASSWPAVATIPGRSS